MRAREWIASSRLVGAGTWVLAGVLIAASVFDPGWVFGSSASSWTYLAAALVWASILLRITRRPWAGSGVVTRAAVWLGRRSYGVYVFHWPAVVLAAWVAGRLPAALTPLIGAGALALVLIGSGLSFRFFESPFLRLKGRFSSDPARAS
jgi:peptidoglycan/LPS O-acetylase OafA/YrhL